jgi:hypothetical protein
MRLSDASGGRVGIGTTGPAYKLDVFGSPRFYGDGNHMYARVSSGDSNKDSYVVFNNTADRFYVGVPASSNSLYLQSGNGGTPVSLVADYTSGNVGIGTVSPVEKLSLAGSTGTTFGLSLEPSGWNSAKHRFSVPISGDISMWSFNWNGTAVDSALYAPASILMAQGTITFNTTGSASSPAPRMIINSAGNVGIGTTSPAGRLHVRNTTSPYQINLQSDTSKVWATGVGISGYYQDWFLLSDGTSDIFRINAGYTEITNNIYASANVGIGTANPSQKLDVAGAISVSGSVIDYKASAALIAAITTTNVVSFTPGTTKAAFIDYMIIDSSTGTNQRVGTIMVSISLNTVSAVINEITTVDIGNTAAVRFGVSYGPPVQITATNSGITPYDIKYMVRYF